MEADSTLLLGPALTGALDKRGFTELTPVQRAVLAPGNAGRDLRISSQTGSGKTVAIGLAVRELVTGPGTREPVGCPTVLVITPTRELARQVEQELGWLFAPVGARIVSVTGGTSPREERRALATGPSIVVGTPGRLLDHLTRGALELGRAKAVVLDEADRMLEMGFREDLEAILSHAPEDRRTHLVSATFPRLVMGLANRVQKDPVHIEGTRLGEANADIEHVLHLCEEGQRLDVLVNLLLARPDEQTLVFARTRADVAGIGRELQRLGFATATLSGEMEQGERERALATFKHGGLRVLVATDVAARGLDVQDVGRVLHVETPNDPDAYTHRSGRTGRAGRRGTSGVIVSLDELGFVKRILAQAGVTFRFEPVPTAAELRALDVERIFASLTQADDPAEGAIEPHVRALAARLAQAPDIARVFERLLTRGVGRVIPPREITLVAPPPERPKATRREPAYKARGPEPRRSTVAGTRAAGLGPRRDAPARGRGAAPTDADRAQEGDAFAKFRVTWGEAGGADPRRLVALVCRRGRIRGDDVGAIRVGRDDSIVEVRRDLAEQFAAAVARPDTRDPNVFIWPLGGGPPRDAARMDSSAPGARAPANPTKRRPPGREPKPGAAPPRRKGR